MRETPQEHEDRKLRERKYRRQFEARRSEEERVAHQLKRTIAARNRMKRENPEKRAMRLQKRRMHKRTPEELRRQREIMRKRRVAETEAEFEKRLKLSIQGKTGVWPTKYST